MSAPRAWRSRPRSPPCRDHPKPTRVLAIVLDVAGEAQQSTAHLEAALRRRPDDERSWIALVRARESAVARETYQRLRLEDLER